MITIGIDASRANRAERTGVEWYAFHLIQEFKKIIPGDFRVILYSAEPLMGELAELPPNWESKIIKGVNLGRGPWLWTQLGLTLEMIFNKPDILFVPSHAIPLIHPKRTYTTIHDIGFEVFPESYGFLARLYHRFSARLALRSAAKIFTPSEFTKSELIKYYKADPSKIIVTPLGFDSSIYHVIPTRAGEAEESLRRVVPQLFSPPNNVGGARGGQNPYILFIGRIEKKKNVKRLIQAFLELKKELSSRPERSEAEGSLKLVIIGKPGFGYDEIKASASEKISPPAGGGVGGGGSVQINKGIIFTGYVPAKDLPGLVAGASVYALPSLYEGFGIPILEAMASGVPVLTSNVASMPEVACPNRRPERSEGSRGSEATRATDSCAACLVDPLSVESIKEGMRKILTDQAYHDDLVAKGLVRVKDFSWELTAKKTVDFIISR